MSVLNQVAIVTGGGMGLGKAIATELVLQGAHVFICGRSKYFLKETNDDLRELRKSFQYTDYKVTNVSSTLAVREFVDYVWSHLGRVDILINNAGVYGPIGPTEEVDWDEWVEAIEINLMGTVNCCRAVLPHMRKNNYGRIINISGGGATNALPNFSAYAASKAAVVRFTETLALELSNTNITVNAVSPGPLNTRMLDQVLKAGEDKAGFETIAKARQQLITGGSSTETAAKLVTMLASTVSSKISGLLLSAVWDDWNDLGKLERTIADEKMYKLRRISP